MRAILAVALLAGALALDANLDSYVICAGMANVSTGKYGVGQNLPYFEFCNNMYDSVWYKFDNPETLITFPDAKSCQSNVKTSQKTTKIVVGSCTDVSYGGDVKFLVTRMKGECFPTMCLQSDPCAFILDFDQCTVEKGPQTPSNITCAVNPVSKTCMNVCRPKLTSQCTTIVDHRCQMTDKCSSDAAGAIASIAASGSLLIILALCCCSIFIGLCVFVFVTMSKNRELQSRAGAYRPTVADPVDEDFTQTAEKA